MPQKKTSATGSSKSNRETAPAVPKVLAQQIKTDTSSTADSETHKITVRTTNVQTTDPAPVTQSASDILDNSETDKAVDDIMAKESDTILAVDDLLADQKATQKTKSSWTDSLKKILRNKWTWIGLAVVLCLLFALPYTRYKILGTVLKKEITVTVVDNQTDTPVSDALVAVSGASAKTDAYGNATLKAGVGKRVVTITKQYYRNSTATYFVGLSSSHALRVKLLATGRLVPITVQNTISGQPLAGVLVHVLATTAKTNNNGLATFALPTNAQSYSATISAAGYNTDHATVVVTSLKTASNSFDLTPSGSIFYLSKQSGTINVDKANLDGSDQQIVLAGTGDETASTTRLIASPDWKYVVLEANRSGIHAALYLIDTSNNQVTEFDSSTATFNLIGWYGDDFIYALTTSQNPWQDGVQAVKDYDASNEQLNELDQTQGSGTSSSYGQQTFSNYYILGDALVYNTQWSEQGGYDLSSDNDTIRVLSLSSQIKKDEVSLPAANTGSMQATRYLPQAAYFATQNASKGFVTYYQYANQTTQEASISKTTFDAAYPNYIPSPSGDHTVWETTTNGQNLLFVGDENGGSQKQIESLGNYVPYGWYSDNYVLISQDNDRLYIMPSSGLAANHHPTSIASYYEPATDQSGYEYDGY
jgi:hypothetical protein